MNVINNQDAIFLQEYNIFFLKSIHCYYLFNYYSLQFTDEPNINTLVPSAHKSARIAKISILNLEGIIKKFL